MEEDKELLIGVPNNKCEMIDHCVWYSFSFSFIIWVYLLSQKLIPTGHANTHTGRSFTQNESEWNMEANYGAFMLSLSESEWNLVSTTVVM